MKKLIPILLLLSACGGPQLDDQVVEHYIQAYRQIRAVSPQLAASLKKPDFTAADGQAGYDQIEAAVKQAGFRDMGEFVQVNARIGMAFSQLHGAAFMGEMDQKVKQGLAQLDNQLKNPKLPAETRKQLETTRQQLLSQYQQGKPWAEGVMKTFDKSVDAESVAVVKKHEQELLALFQGK
ncbi:MAG: hypothetical protein ACAI44_03835 [Candidatus Sericytochromatia bacterium]